MSDRMQTVRLHGPRDVRVESAEAPAASTGDQVRLRMRSVGICGSDLHHYREGSTGDNAPDSPLVLGHEIAAEVPPETADTLGLAPSTLVAVDPAHPCGVCEWCEHGHPNLCPHVEFKGVEAHRGGLAEYLTAHPDEIIPVPDEFDADTAALLEPLGVAIHALDLAELRSMDTVAVLGGGRSDFCARRWRRRRGPARAMSSIPSNTGLKWPPILGPMQSPCTRPLSTSGPAGEARMSSLKRQTIRQASRTP